MRTCDRVVKSRVLLALLAPFIRAEWVRVGLWTGRGRFIGRTLVVS